MKIMTFNVQHFLDYKNQVIDFELFAGYIKKQDADFCGLNEVRGEGPLKGYTDQINTVADKIGCERYFGEAIKVMGTSPYGNAFVTKHKIKSVSTIKIPSPVIRLERASYESRCVIRSVVEIDGRDIMFLVCHMGLAKSERKRAVNAICRILDESDLPCILMGDFNTTPDNGVLEPIYARLEDTDACVVNKGHATYPSDSPRDKIDYMFFRGLTCKKCVTLIDVVSDHLPIVAEFEFCP